MKILWVTNILFPEAKSIITQSGDLKSSGGWMIGMADALTERNDIQLFVATVSSLVSSLVTIKGKKITYYVIPFGKGYIKYNSEYESYWIEIYNKCEPDIVHIHGTEYSHGLAFLKACPYAKSVISIQGLTSVYSKFYNQGLDFIEITKNITLRDLLRKDTLCLAKRNFEKRGKYIEKPMLQNIKYIIGRTSWDKSHVWNINPHATYYFCNEVLRNVFYDGSRWEYEKCTKHTIFLSQAGYPIKGLHQVIKAMPLILREFPNTKIFIAGRNIIQRNTLKECLLFSGYSKIIYKMIKKYKLDGHIEFLGSLNGEEMKDAYLKCNVFICPSSIENSPNSLGEAQILGVPCIASYVGGIPDMIPNEECGLMYRFEDTEMLASRVIKVFNNARYFDNYKMRKVAFERHDKETNTKQLVQIYHNILKR